MEKYSKTNFLNKDQILNYLTKKLINENINFIAFVMSPFHMLGVDAYLLETKEKYQKPLKGIIFIFPHPKDGIIIRDEHINCKKFVDVEIIYVVEFQIQKKKYVDKIINIYLTLRGILYTIFNKNNNKRELFIISVLDPYFSIFKIFSNKKIANQYRPTFIVIDEGVGSYMSKKIWKLVTKYEKDIKKNSKKNIKLFTIIKDISKDFLSSIVQLIKKPIFYFFKVENRLIFKQYNNTLIPNYSVINSYKKVLYKFKKDNYKKFIPTFKKPIIILSTQPFVEYNQIKEYTFIKVVEKIINILEKNDFVIFLKPHPRELLDKYEKLLLQHKNLIIVPKSILLEEILLSCSPTAIIGFTSTSLITSKLFYNIHSISITDLIIKLSNDPLLKLSAKEFKLKFQNIIYFIGSLKELNYIIKRFKY